MDKKTAQAILAAIEAGDTNKLEILKVRTYGNKGRVWSQTACITNLDPIKGQCNPRLATNYSTLNDIGCPDCIAKLKEIAES